ncbi:phosphogluconate dehydrogenase (decarboxylating), NAD binding domain-containing protein [Toxoplasma gondii VAND]|uniref:3-hydroxyisobutyrate dehydrogenase n=2 Tax=Toxoplasma gondii TaxID=5811 RepID=V5BLA9_TOXGV|nr:phosphogluconate dehydrogenase (decarboxylating), NAD binding domain-containing protein [Toxoplasma gondii VEG]KFH11761.1 phosphogluconate dehydrogenase (decarboxylating), NAD binding domain-containing protein [Toxoplasma gondii VAND]
MAATHLSSSFGSVGKGVQGVLPFLFPTFLPPACGDGWAGGRFSVFQRGFRRGSAVPFCWVKQWRIPSRTRHSRLNRPPFSVFPLRTRAYHAYASMSSAHDSHPQQVEPSVQPFRDGDLSTHIAEVAEKHTGRLVGFLGLGNMGLPMATHLAGRGIRLCVYDPGKSDASYHLQKQFGAVPACSVADLGSKLRASFLSHGNVETETCEGSTRQEVLRRCVEPVSDQGRAFRSTSFPAVSHSAALQKEPHVAEWQHDANQILRENRDFAACGAAPPFPVVISMLPSGRHVEEALLSDNGLLRALEGASGKAQDSLDLCRAFVIDCSTIGPLHAVEIAERVTRRGHHFVDAPVSGGVPGLQQPHLGSVHAGRRRGLSTWRGTRCRFEAP